MSIAIVVQADSGKTLFASLQQLGDDGTLGNTWSNTASAWATTVSDANCAINLTAGTGREAGTYSGGVDGTLQTYTGDILLRVHDSNLSDVTISVGTFETSSGLPVTISTVAPTVSAVVSVADSRKWRLTGNGENLISSQIISLAAGTTATLSFGFSTLLNPGTDLSDVTTVAVAEVISGVAPAIGSAAISADRNEVHFSVSGTVAGKYRIKATATTTDGQTIVTSGLLTVI